MRLLAVAGMGVVTLFGTLLTVAIEYAGFAGDVAPPPPPSELRVFEASRPAVAMVNSDWNYNTSVKVPDLTPAGAAVFHSLTAGHTPPEAVVDALLANPEAYLRPGAVPLPEEYTSSGWGSGFFVDEKGTMIAASHVVAPGHAHLQDELNRLFDDPLATKGVDGDLAMAMAKELDLPDFTTSGPWPEAVAGWLPGYLKANTTIESETTDLTVAYGTVDPNRYQSDSATVVHAEDPFPGRDVAVLKVAIQGSVPALPLSGEDHPVMGEVADKIGYGLPASAGESDPLPAGFAEGRVDASNLGEGLDAYATEADFHPGDSGGPVLDGQGRVIGMISYSGSYDNGSSAFGQNYFIPAIVIRTTLARAGVRPDPGTLTESYYRALAQADRSRYRAALPLLASIHAADPEDPYVAADRTSADAAIRAGKDRTGLGTPWLPMAGGLAIAAAVLTIAGAAWLSRPVRPAPPPPPATIPPGWGSASVG